MRIIHGEIIGGDELIHQQLNYNSNIRPAPIAVPFNQSNPLIKLSAIIPNTTFNTIPTASSLRDTSLDKDFTTTIKQTLPKVIPNKDGTPYKVGEAIGEVGGTILGNLVRGLVSKIDPKVNEVVTDVAVMQTDNTINKWIAKHWLLLFGSITVFFALIFFITKRNKQPIRRRYA